MMGKCETCGNVRSLNRSCNCHQCEVKFMAELEELLDADEKAEQEGQRYCDENEDSRGGDRWL